VERLCALLTDSHESVQAALQSVDVLQNPAFFAPERLLTRTAEGHPRHDKDQRQKAVSRSWTLASGAKSQRRSRDLVTKGANSLLQHPGGLISSLPAQDLVSLI